MRLPLVLLYHIIAPCPADGDADERSLFVAPGNFEQQMNDLVGRGYKSLSLDQFAAVVSGAPSPPRSFMLTFDDAYAHVDDMVTPVLEHCGFSAVMFACPAQLGRNNTWDSSHPNLARLEIATESQLRGMARGRWQIGSHGMSHVDHRGLQPEQLAGELRDARLRLSEMVAGPVLDLAYPFGQDNPAVRQAAKAAGYRMAFTAWHAAPEDPMHLPRRPIAGTDSMTTFRLKTSPWSDALYRARGAALTLLGAGAG